MLPYREAQLLHKIASKTPPISAEDAAAVGGAGDVDKSWGSAHARLNRLVRLAARQRAISGRSGRRSTFCPLEAAVAVLTSHAKSQAMAIGAGGEGEGGGRDLFEVFFFLLDVGGGSAVDAQRYACVAEDVSAIREGSDDMLEPVSVDTFIGRLLRLQTLFGVGEPLRRYELDLIASMASEHSPHCKGPVITFGGLLGFLSFAPGNGPGKSAAHRHRALQRRERKAVLQTLRLKLSESSVTDDPESFLEALGALTDSDSSGVVSLAAVEPKKLHSWFLKHCRSVGVTDLTRDEVLALLRDIKASSLDSHYRDSDAAGLADGGSVVSSDCFVTMRCLEAFLKGDNHSTSSTAPQGAAAASGDTATRNNNHNYVILDVCVGPTAPRALAGGYAYHQVCVHSAGGGSIKSSSSRSSRAHTNPHQDSSHGGLNLGSSSILSSPPVYVWCLRGKSDDACGSNDNHGPEAEPPPSGNDDHDDDSSWPGEERHMWAGTPRLAPVVDLRIEEEKASSDLVAAGYTFVGAVARASRFLWLRRARSRAEARDLALTELAFTAGEMRRMDDRMHLPPSHHHRRHNATRGGTWVEVGSRALQSVALLRSMRPPSKHHQGDEMGDDYDDTRSGLRKAPLAGKKDMKLWCRRDSENAVPSDRLTLCLNRWSEPQRRRELEDAVRRGLRQMPPGVLLEGTHSHRVDCAVDHNRVFNEVTGGSGTLTLPVWTKLLSLAGLLIDPDDNVALFRRLFVAGMASSAPKKNGTVTQATYVAFASRTEDEIDGIAEQVRHDLRWRFGISRQAGVDSHARAQAQLKDALAQVARADKRGLSLEHLGYLLAAGGGLDAHLSRAELWRLAQRFDANFRGTIDLKRFIHFIGADGGSEDANGNAKTSHLLRVTGATDALRDMVEELLGRPKIGNLEEAASEVWRSLCNGHFRRLGKPPVKPSRGGIWSCMGDNSAAFRSVLLDPEDLSVAVERRLVGSRQTGDGLRLSHTEATQLAFLVAPCNLTGKISRREFMDFFAPSHEHRLLRPITAVLEEVSGFDKLLGKYEAWLASAHKALAGQLKKGEDDEKRAELLRHYESKTKSYVAARDTTINDLVAQVNAHFRTMPNDPAVGAVDLVRVPWASEASLRREGEMKDDNDEDEGEGERDREGEGGEGSSQLSHGPHPPFRSASEVALLVLHCQADYFEEGFIQNDYSGEDGGNGSDSEDSERRQVRNRNTNAVPPAPKPLGSNRSHGKGGVLAEASGGVHMVKLRSLLEGFCKLRLGPVPHVPHGGGAAAVPQEPDNHDGAPSSVDPSSSDKKKKADGDLPAVALVLGDALSEKFLSGVVRQLATGQKKRKDPEVSDGWLGGVAGAVVGLLQSFAHPTVDPYPSRGVVSPRDFRKALALSGVMVTADEVEDAAEPFLVASGGTQIDYERFIALLRRAWLAEWDSDGSDSSSDKGELADARKFLGLLRVHFEALSALQLNDTTTTNFDISQGGDVSGIAVDSGLLRSLRKLFKRADGGDGRLGPADLLECLRIATDQAVALAEKQFSHRFTAGDETSAAAVPRWMGDKENLPLAGGRARRLMRRLFEFLDDEGDGRVDGEEVLMLLDRGTVGDPAAERRGQLLEHTAKTFTSGRGSGMRGSMRFGGGGGDDYGGRGGDSSDDDDEDGDWLLSGIVNPDASNMSGSSFSRFGRLARVTNTAKDEEVALHPSIAKLARAVAERWPSDKDRAALKQYLQRHVRQNGTLGEQRFMRFLRKAGLLSDMSRRDVSGVLAILDPSKSQTVPVKLVLEHVIKEESVKKEEKAEKTPEEEQKEEAEKRMQKVLKEKEIDRICRHVLDISSEYGSLTGTGNLIPAFRHFDPRGRGCVPPSTASDVLAFLGCNLVDEECSLLWGCVDGFKDSQEIEYERLDHIVALRAGHLPNQAPESPMMMRQTQQHATFTSPHVSFAVGNTPSHASRFFGRQPAASAIRPGNNRLSSSMQQTPRRSHGVASGGRDHDDEALLKALARNLVTAGESEAAAWGQPTFQASTFFGQRCDPRGEGDCSLEDLAMAAERLGVSLTREEAAALDACFGVGSGGVDYVSFGHFIDRIGGRSNNQKDARRMPENGRGAALSKTGGDVRSSIEKSADTLPHAVISLLRLVGPTIMAQQRLGLDAAMTFEMHDPSDTGCCSVEAFVEAMRQFDLRMSLDHLQMLVGAFASSQGDDTVNYRAFLKQATLATHGDAQQDVYPSSSSRFNNNRGGFSSSNRLMTGARLAPMPDPLRASWDPSFAQDQPPSQAPLPGGRSVAATEAPTLMIDTYAGGNVLSSGGALSSPSRSAAVAIWGAGTPLRQKGTIPSEVKSQLANAGRWMCLTCLFADNTPLNARCDVCGAGNPTGAEAQVQQECPACHFFNSPFCSSCDMCHRPLRGHASTSQVPPEVPSSKMDETSFALHRAPASSGRRNRREVENSGWAYGSDSD